MRVVVFLASGVLVSGCTSVGLPASGPTTTVTATVTSTKTVSASPSPTSGPLGDLFDEGFPNVISVTEVPEYMRSSVDGDQVVAIAPGVYTEYIEGIDVVDLALDGSPFGLCAAVVKWERSLVMAGYDIRGNTCW